MELADLLVRGEAALSEAIALGTSESLLLDFKADGKEGLFAAGALTREGRRVLARAMSAFANSAGGLIVIGVDCRRVDDVDQAQALQPIAHLSKAYSSLSGQLAELLQPRHDGLRVHKIAKAGADDEGYLIVEVPRSERRPHMSGIERTYHKRSSASTFVMEHYDVEDAFRRQATPVLEIDWAVRAKSLHVEALGVSIDLFVENLGFATARHVGLFLVAEQGISTQIPLSHEGFAEETSRALNRRGIIAPPAYVINPGHRRPFHRLEFSVMRDGRGDVTIGGLYPDEAFYDAVVEFGAENMQPQRSSIYISKGDLRPLVQRFGG